MHVVLLFINYLCNSKHQTDTFLVSSVQNQFAIIDKMQRSLPHLLGQRYILRHWLLTGHHSVSLFLLEVRQSVIVSGCWHPLSCQQEPRVIDSLFSIMSAILSRCPAREKCHVRCCQYSELLTRSVTCHHQVYIMILNTIRTITNIPLWAIPALLTLHFFSFSTFIGPQ